VLTSLRGCICNGEAGRPRKRYEMSLAVQAGNGLLRSQAVMAILGLIAVLVVVGVIFPAVWSGKNPAHRRSRCARPSGAVAALTHIGRQPCRAGWTPGGTTPPVLTRPGTA
jgi:hypothetical protein